MATKSEVLLMALAVKEGLIGKESVQAGMNEQKRLAEQGQSFRLEDVIIKLGHMSADQFKSLRAPAPVAPPQPISLEDARRIPIYEIHEAIGQGGMASVFSATLRDTGEPRAVKILYREHLANKQFVDRFLREGKLLKSFDCPSIAKGYEYGRAGKDLYFMGMELIQGPSLQDMLDKDGPFDENMAIHCVTEAARSLAYMQSKGIVHRDIKPDNIMWNSDGRVMLVDLGFATPIKQDAAADEYESETCGTVQYISPEQAKGKADLDIRADIYSLGATLYHLVVGELPFSGKDSMEVMAKQVMENLSAQTLKGGKISMHMHYIIEKMMAKDRDIRYQTAQEAVEDIETVLAGAADLQFDPSRFGLAGGSDMPARISSGRLGQIKPSSNRAGRISSGRTQRVSGSHPVTRKPSNPVPKTDSGRNNPAPSQGGQKTVRLPNPRRTTGRITATADENDPGVIPEESQPQTGQVRFPSVRKRPIQ
ncbi:MAG: serine/threonine protein kinase [Planctomycetaceae bacterium]|nr:serine/threonine protein kinase [Planctomycetaceae bacterium]